MPLLSSVAPSAATNPSAALHPTLRSAKRNYASSIKAIMHSRHANTGRRQVRIKREAKWIGEVVVVKLYDQRDSLREVLEQPARIHPVETQGLEAGEVEVKEQEQEQEQVVEEIPCRETRSERIGKRKREDEEAVLRCRGDTTIDDEVNKRRRIGEKKSTPLDNDEADRVTRVEVVIPKKSSTKENVCPPSNCPTISATPFAKD